MIKMKKRVITALMVLAAAGLASCAKRYDEAETETLKRQQTEIEIPQDTPWDNVPQPETEAGH